MAFEAKANSMNKSKWTKYVNPVNWAKGFAKFFVNCGVFIKESFGEMKRITWPSKKRIIKSTSVVFSAVTIITLFIWVVDSVFNLGLNYFLKLVR